MKKCPKCSSVYTFETNFCLHDGVPLIEEMLFPTVAVSDETETIIKSRPAYPFPPPHVPSDEKKIIRGVGKSLLFVISGFVLGAILLVSLIFIAASRTSRNEKNFSNANSLNAQLTSDKHRNPNKLKKDADFTGFVQVENGNLRSAPNSETIDILPKYDRVNMIERSGPWYQITCEHGVSGWMHGNNLDWMPEAVPF